jgi:hypothetical protein
MMTVRRTLRTDPVLQFLCFHSAITVLVTMSRPGLGEFILEPVQDCRASLCP